MRSYSESATIDAAPETVWSILANVEAWPAWTPTVTKSERLDQGAIGIGSRTRILQPKLRPAVWVITDWRPNEAFTWVSNGAGFKVTAEHVLERVGSGCRLTLHLRFGGLIGAVVGALGANLTRQYLRLEANGLKQHSERPPRTVPA